MSDAKASLRALRAALDRLEHDPAPGAQADPAELATRHRELFELGVRLRRAHHHVQRQLDADLAQLAQILGDLGARSDTTGDDADAFDDAHTFHPEVPAGATVRVVAPAWRDATHTLLARGRRLVSRGRPTPAVLALEAARDALRPRRDARACFDAWVAQLADDPRGALVTALRTLEAEGAPTAAYAGLRRELAALGAEVLPAPGPFSLTDDTPHLEVDACEDPAPPGTILQVARHAVLADGALLDGVGRVRVSRGPLSDAERLVDAVAHPAAQIATRALAGLERDARDDTPGQRLVQAASVTLHRDDAADLAAPLDAWLRARGWHLHPGDDEAPDPERVDVTRVPAEAPLGALVRVHTLSYTDPGGDLVHRGQVEVSRGPRDPLEEQLETLEALLGRDGVPAGAPLPVLSAQRTRLAAGERPEVDALAEALVALEGAAGPEAQLASAGCFRLLQAYGVRSEPSVGQRAWTPTPDAEVLEREDDAPSGQVLEVERRGVWHAERCVVRPRVVLSLGPRSSLLTLLDTLAAEPLPPEWPTALTEVRGPAAELRARVETARSAAARGDASGRAARIDDARAFARTLTDLADDPEVERWCASHLFPALALLDPDVEVFPDPAAHEPPDLALCNVEERYDPRVPAGSLLGVRRYGFVDRRHANREVTPAHVVISLGPRPPLEAALDALAPEEAPDEALADALAAPTAQLRRALLKVRTQAHLGQDPDLSDVARAAATLQERVEAHGHDAWLSGRWQDALEATGLRWVRPDDPEAWTDAERVYDLAPEGTTLRRVHHGLVAGDEVVRPAVDALSLGPRPALARAADALEALGDDLPPAAKAAVGLERAVEADRKAGRPAHGAGTLRQRTVAMADALEPIYGVVEALEPIARGPLKVALEEADLVPFPLPGELVSDDVEDLVGRADPAPRGTVLAVERWGLRDGQTHERVREARAVISLGPLAAAFAEHATPDALRDVAATVNDPRAEVDEDAVLRAVFAAWRDGDASARPLLDALEAEVFPEQGGKAPAADAADLERVWDAAPSGQVLDVTRPGLRWRGRVLERAAARVSRGPLEGVPKALFEASQAATGDLSQTLDAAVERACGLDDAALDALLIEQLAAAEDARASAEAVAPLLDALRERGFQVLPEAAGGAFADLPADAFEPPREVRGDQPEGHVGRVERRAVLRDGVRVRGRVQVVVGPATPLYQGVESVREALADALDDPEAVAAAQTEVDDALERLASAKADREALAVLPVMTLLQRLELKDKLGADLKERLLEVGVKELIAYPNYDANKLGVSKLEEVRVQSERARGKIVRVLRPGYVRLDDGAVLQKVRAEVSR